MNITNQKIIAITGASSGIGKAMAVCFSRQGHRVYGLSRSSVESDFTSMSVDITNAEAVKNAIASIVEKESKIDVLINNAGMGMVGAVEDTKAEEIQKLFNLNLVGAVQVMSAVLPFMREQRSGKIINISSIGSEMGLPFRGFYSASKAALDKVTEAVRYEVRPWNVQICALHLGDVKTDIAQNRVRSEVSAPYREVFNKVYALMNSHVDSGDSPEAVARYVERLLSKPEWRSHYYFGKFGQKIGVPLKWLLPQKIYEKLMRKYNHID
ncbi:SDR family oxidoreductase [Riemerella columbipharyngis]|uniref:Short-chain dehydrogenase n=1 Tax=Riemerella columbipharyngis TaxID=1071918 RepID=A0A1G7BQR9_9FLAO|nr:SDR family oxidoreductase [Riemerella columbipharyngis]SDE28696.1 Short-chain dehydrogenase [Riemerella columbipharyngis]